MRVFLAGIIQGSNTGPELHDQSYRDEIRNIVRAQLPEAAVICPVSMHPNSGTYGPAEARRTFFAMVEEVKRADAVIAYLPEASMGTAIEIWEAHRLKVPVVTISPIQQNWVINLFSDRIFGSIAEFKSFVAQGGLAILAGRRG